MCDLCIVIAVNISERKSGTERTKKRKKRELVFFPPPGGATGTVVQYIQQNHANTKIGMTQNVVIKEMLLIWQEGDIETIKVRKILN